MKRMPALALAVLAGAVAPATPSHAGGLPVAISADIYLDSWTGDTAKICAFGSVNNGQAPVVVQWMFEVTAIRYDDDSNFSTFWPTPLTVSGSSFSLCQDVSTWGEPHGVLTGHLAATAVDLPDLSGADVAGVANLAATWSPSDPHPEAFWVGTP